MSIFKTAKVAFSSISRLQAEIKKTLYRNLPEILGHETNNHLIQLYRNDELFETEIGFSHFLETFTGLDTIKITVKILAYDARGQFCGNAELTINGKGNLQVRLNDLIPNLDRYGFFTVSLAIAPRHLPEISYLGALSPQFMTLFVPKDNFSSVQMLHSHKRRQGLLTLPFQISRSSAHIEDIGLAEEIELYFLNSCPSPSTVVLSLTNSETNQPLSTRKARISGYGVERINITGAWHHETPTAILKYSFSKRVSHTKPIIFRKSPSRAWSCNHI